MLNIGLRAAHVFVERWPSADQRGPSAPSIFYELHSGPMPSRSGQILRKADLDA